MQYMPYSYELGDHQDSRCKVIFEYQLQYSIADRPLVALHEPFFHPVSFAIVLDESALF